MANKKITDATTATSVAGTDKVFLNQGGDLKQVDLNSAVANSQAVQTLNSNLNHCYCKGVDNIQTKKTIKIDRRTSEQIIFFMLAGTLDKLEYGLIVKQDVLILNKYQTNIPISFDSSNSNIIIFSIGNYGRGMFISYLPFDIIVS